MTAASTQDTGGPQTRDAIRRKAADAEMWKRMGEPKRPCPECGGEQWTRWSSSIWRDFKEIKRYIWFCPECRASEIKP